MLEDITPLYNLYNIQYKDFYTNKQLGTQAIFRIISKKDISDINLFTEEPHQKVTLKVEDIMAASNYRLTYAKAENIYDFLDLNLISPKKQPTAITKIRILTNRYFSQKREVELDEYIADNYKNTGICD